MKSRLYLETTIPSYLTAWTSRDVVMAGHQQITCDWWAKRQNDFDIFISEFVLNEAASGDAEAAKHRLDFLAPFPLLEVDDAVFSLADEIVRAAAIPAKAGSRAEGQVLTLNVHPCLTSPEDAARTAAGPVRVSVQPAVRFPGLFSPNTPSGKPFDRGWRGYRPRPSQFRCRNLREIRVIRVIRGENSELLPFSRRAFGRGQGRTDGVMRTMAATVFRWPAFLG